MPKRITFLFIALNLALAACQGAAGTEGASQGPTRTPTDNRQTVTQTPISTSAITGKEIAVAKCTAVSRAPTPGPTEASLFKPVSEADWVKGPNTAAVTIIEYSDFQ